MTKIAVIGGGVIGLATAYYLRKHNQDVVVIDKSIPGEACSAGNMGWICPTLSAPVPAPGLVGTSLKWMLKKDSPLYIKPTTVPSNLSWFYRFWRHCNESAFLDGYNAMLEISKDTLSLFEELDVEGLVKYEIHKDGLLFLFTTEEAIERKFKELSTAHKVGIPRPVIKSRKEVLELEPNISDEVVGGLMLPAERHVRPESLSQGLYNWLLSNGVEVRTNTEVTNFIQRNSRIEAIECGGEIIKANQFLITTGIWSQEIAKKIGFKLPMTTGKGYSITIPQPRINIRQPLYLGDSKVGISPYNDALRIAGTMELSGINTDIDVKRVEGLRNSVKKYLKIPLTDEKEIVWAGMRPMTPDGLPVLGKIHNIKNLFVATGHAMSGISMSLSTGKIMTNLMLTDSTDIDITPFSPSRF